MKKLFLSIALLSLVIFSAKASAWYSELSSDYECKDGWLVTWIIKNPEGEPLTVRSSNRTSVPIGTEVPANQTKKIYESINGDNASLSIAVNWPSDMKIRNYTTKVTFKDKCVKSKPSVAQQEAPKPETTPVTTPIATPVEQLEETYQIIGK